MKIVLTGPSTTPYAREYLSNAAATLRKRGHDVFVPHEGGWTAPESPASSDRSTFQATYQALREAELLMPILDGYTVDDAVAAQLGAFHAHAHAGNRPRRIIAMLHDTRVAGWDWSGADRALTPHIRDLIHDLGAVYPNFNKALAALEKEGA